MKLFLVTRTDSTLYNWDITLGFVIAADNEKEALEFATFEEDIDEKYIDVKEIGEANSSIEKGVILEDLNG